MLSTVDLQVRFLLLLMLLSRGLNGLQHDLASLQDGQSKATMETIVPISQEHAELVGGLLVQDALQPLCVLHVLCCSPLLTSLSPSFCFKEYMRLFTITTVTIPLLDSLV